ncbi:hypothetical protein BSQ39_09105 [Loigolactobacillus backii]|uniref:helix-turn-helix domain-containing protein n=1 Tax=Loigolactobacillus backii TaxID=375175 RepID=UPI000C1C8F82|nr:helix-turn-helix transcriptional regulator [Loigolactobacillus backii]PIO83712.1 hypothetical protein BSQ39_09105 [Loigolactobacillus backii]
MIKLVGNFIRKKRKELGITIEVLAEKADVSASYLARLERGQLEDTSTKKLDAILDALGLDLTDILISNDFDDTYTPKLINKLKKLDTNERVRISKAILELLN